MGQFHYPFNRDVINIYKSLSIKFGSRRGRGHRLVNSVNNMEGSGINIRKYLCLNINIAWITFISHWGLIMKNEAIRLNKTKFDMMVDLEDNWMKPPLPYPIWSLDRETKMIYIYHIERYKETVLKYKKEMGLCTP